MTQPIVPCADVADTVSGVARTIDAHSGCGRFGARADEVSIREQIPAHREGKPGADRR